MTESAGPDRGTRLTRRNAIRVAFVVLLLFSAVLFADYAMATADTPEANSTAVEATPGPDGRTGTADPSVTRTPAATGTTESLTVVTEQVGPLKVFDRSGNLVYEYDRYERYWDVDPSPVGNRTLLYTATVTTSPDACDGTVCKTNVVGRLNLTTGEHQELFERTYASSGSNEWHDVDRVNDSHIVVAGIKHDRVFFVDTESKEITWQWNASSQYPESVGGNEKDWTHLNDVEVLPDGSIMASIRNMDEIVFIRPGFGVDEDWTLGSTGNHDIMHGQHNADYIPPVRGGPAVIVADSHNNRIVEYQRVYGSWEKTWVWTDARAQWTRDGDRLPNGNTLVTDTNGGRVLEVTASGRIVWSVEATKAYEAERLGTGDESTTGESMTRIRARRADGERDEVAPGVAVPPGQPSSVAVNAWRLFEAQMPPYILNSLLFVLSPYIEPVQLVPVAIAGFVLPVWGVCEFYWRYQPTIVLRGLDESQ